MLISCELTTKVGEYLKRWYGVYARTAALMLVRRGYGNAAIDWDECEKTALEMIQSSNYVDELARDVGPFNFFGGPPGERQLIYKGNLLMFLVDRLLFDDTTRC